jgi:hypothetical protein
LTIEPDHLVEDAWVALEPAMPELIRDDRDPVAARLLLFLGERATQGRPDPEHREELGTHPVPATRSGASASSERLKLELR